MSCGQQLPADKLQQAKEQFEAAKQKRLNDILQTANSYKEAKTQAEDRIVRILEEAAQIEAEVTDLAGRITAAESNVVEIKDMDGKRSARIFNRKEGATGDTWYPSVLHNVQVNIDRASILAKYGAQSQDSAVLNVRYTLDGEAKKVGEKLWLPPKEWRALADPAQAITFASGTKFDFFWIGDWGNEEPVQDADYLADLDFYTYMNRTHDFVFAISSVGGPYSVIPHFEILGK